MLRNKLRLALFFPESAVIALGLIMSLILVLNGFNIQQTILFLDNFTSRMLEAENARARNYEQFLMGLFMGFFTLVCVTRWTDRQSSKPNSTRPQGQHLSMEESS